MINRIRSLFDMSKVTKYILISLAVVCGISLVLAFSVWPEAGFMAFYSGAVLALVFISGLVVLLLSYLKFNVKVLHVLLFANTVISLVFGYRIYYDIFLYSGWFKGLEAAVWLITIIPVVVSIYLYTLIRFLIKKFGVRKGVSYGKDNDNVGQGNSDNGR